MCKKCFLHFWHFIKSAKSAFCTFLKVCLLNVQKVLFALLALYKKVQKVLFALLAL